MGDESVKVAVRVRPFNNREIERNSKCCISMKGNQTTIVDYNDTSVEPKTFTFDHSYWSHSGFKTLPNGVMESESASSPYADQSLVFKDLGQGVLQNAFDGFNTSLFAYGQTGSGKSYSMVGYGVNRGIVPITCDELFKTIEANQKASTSVRYQVMFSMLEIYNEQVRDLLSKDMDVKGGLPVRENPTSGSFYVQGLKRVQVSSYDEIDRRMQEGTSNRTIAATKMNSSSSRAHTVVTIMFEQVSKNAEGQETTKSSEINLVDLAGSERAASTGATGDRLKEGSAINKSLSCLGNVISALAELSGGKKKVLVPYRDSVLTKLLKNSLGGNSKTIMIAALSPADINYEETLSTLRYADRAKQIKNKAIVNESQTDKLIRMLKEENEKLKKQLDGGGIVEVKVGMSEDEISEMRKRMEEEIRAQMEANMAAIEHRNWVASDQVVVPRPSVDLSPMAKEEQLKQKKIKSIPHLVNLNEDPLLSGVVFQFLETSVVRVGKPERDVVPEICLSGLSIRGDHAQLHVQGATVSLTPGVSVAKTKINGMPLMGEVTLHHKDRILFGSNHMYVFINPLNPTPSDPDTPDVVDWEFAQNEIAKVKGFQVNVEGLNKDQQRVQEQVLELLPYISEANAISEEMGKSRVFEVVLTSAALHLEGGEDSTLTASSSSNKQTHVVVKMKDSLTDNEWLWSRAKFIDKRYSMQEFYYSWVDQGDESSAAYGAPKDAADPFYEKPVDIIIGTSNIFLQSLAYALDFDDRILVADHKGEEQGTLSVHVLPCTKEGVGLDDDFFVEEPSELIGKSYHIKVTIKSADIQKAKFSRDGLRCEYEMYGQQGVSSTSVVKGSTSPVFNHSVVFSFTVTPELIEWFENGCLTISLYRCPDLSAPQKNPSKPAVSFREADLKLTRRPSSAGDTMPAAKMRYSSFAVATSVQDEMKASVKRLEIICERHKRREARIRELLKEWKEKPPTERTFDGLHHSITVALSSGNRFRKAANVVAVTMVGKAKSQNQSKDHLTDASQPRKVTSSACTIQ